MELRGSTEAIDRQQPVQPPTQLNLQPPVHHSLTLCIHTIAVGHVLVEAVGLVVEGAVRFVIPDALQQRLQRVGQCRLVGGAHAAQPPLAMPSALVLLHPHRGWGGEEGQSAVRDGSGGY